MDARAALKNLAAWQAADDEERVTVLVSLATSLGAGWRAGRTAVGRHGLGELLRRDLGLSFVVVPGGWLRMGLSADDLYVAARARNDVAPRALWGAAPITARPTRWVRMRPFLLALSGLPPEGSAPVTGDDEPPVRTFALADLKEAVPEGFRLPSEAELEWALREGGTTRWTGVPGDVEVTPATTGALFGELQSGFGLRGLRYQNPCADGAVDYDVESPLDQRPRSTDRGEWLARGAPVAWTDPDGAVLAALAGWRAAASADQPTIVRVAVDLPGLTEESAVDAEGAADQDAAPTEPPAADEPPGPLAEHALVLAALTSDDPRRQDAALAALAHLATGPGHDVAGTATAVAEALATIAPRARVHALLWLADAQVQGHARLAAARPERKRRHELGEDRAAVRAAVAAAGEHLVAQLDDADPDVRSAAALALAFTVDATAETKAALGRRLARESEPGVQAMLILGCVRLGTGFRPPAPEPVIAAAIAIATAFDGPPGVEALTAAVALPPTPHLFFGGGDLARVAIGILRTLDADAQAEGAAAIAERAARDRDVELARTACEMTFGAPSPGAAPRLPDELTSGQRRVLSRLAELDRPFDWLAHGLPPTVAARRRFLALDADGPTDRFVAHGDAEVPLWYALRKRKAEQGLDAAQAELAKLLARLPLAERLAVYLDRHTHQLDDVFARVSFAELLAALTADPAAGRAAVDEVVNTPASGPRGPELVRAIAATRPGEELPEALLAEIDAGSLGRDLDALRPFRPAAVARHLNSVLQPVLDRALKTDDVMAGLDGDLGQWAKVLALAPSPMATRRMLLLGWASGQPAAVRAAVGAAARGQSSLEAVLQDYDRQPTFQGWPGARAALPSFVE